MNDTELLMLLGSVVVLAGAAGFFLYRAMKPKASDMPEEIPQEPDHD